jgi:hypothetical protein
MVKELKSSGRADAEARHREADRSRVVLRE